MDALERRLWAAAQYRAAAYGFKPACETLLRDFISAGVRNAGQAVMLNTAQAAMIEANLVRFVDAMIAEAQRNGLQELGETTFHFAFSSLCPLFPFC
jgi:hypothetical protein